MKKGRIIPNGVSLEKHEYDTILFLTTLGHNIELMPPSRIPGVRTPDFKIQMPNDKAITIVKQLFERSKSAKRLLIITKDRKLLDLTK